MIQSVNNYPVSQLFDIEAGVVYAIPRYQRAYSWGKNQWKKLFDDVLENEQGYFLGSIICINQSTDALSIQKLELVDGQQRLTTLSLLLSAVYQILKSYKNDLDDEQGAELINLKHKLVLKKGGDKIRLLPQNQGNNFDDYRAVLADAGIIGDAPYPHHAGNRQIFRAYRYFQDRINRISNEENNLLHTIMAFIEKVSHACMVKIEVASHADAYILFETLNDRGIPLTAVDLIKNKLLARLESIEPSGEGAVDHNFENWKRLLNYLGDDYTIQERFFRQYYNAFRNQLKAIPQVQVAIRSNLIQIYEKLIDHNAKDCLQKLSDAGRLYSLILSRNEDEALNALENDLKKPLKDLERIQGTPSYLLILYLLVRKNELKLENSHLSSIVKLLVRFFVYRNLTDTPSTRDLPRLFITVINKISGLRAHAITESIKQELLAVSVTDDYFQRKLRGPIYEENVGVTRFILCALAEESMTKESWVDLWQRGENKKFVWTIEHIFPKGENIPMPWITMIADGDEKRAKEIQETHVHKLGNLTISAFNSKLGNRSFEDKRDHTDKQGLPVGYKNGLTLNKDLAVATGWSHDQIDSRTKNLVQLVTQRFKLSEADV